MFTRLVLGALQASRVSSLFNQPTAGIATYYRWKLKMKNHRRKKRRRKLKFLFK